MAVLDVIGAYDIIKRIIKKKLSLGPIVGPEEVQYGALRNGSHVNVRIVEVKRDGRGYAESIKLQCEPSTIEVYIYTCVALFILTCSHVVDLGAMSLVSG